MAEKYSSAYMEILSLDQKRYGEGGYPLDVNTVDRWQQDVNRSIGGSGAN
jgi:hypothetical protein